MKLKEYNSNNVKRKKSRPSISLHTNGVIGLSAALVQTLGIKEGTMLSFLQDEENPTNWYLKMEAIDGFPVKRVNSKRHQLCIQTKGMINIMIHSLQIINKGFVVIPVSIIQEKPNIYPLITKAVTEKGGKV
jgi:hypothetical protein